MNILKPVFMIIFLAISTPNVIAYEGKTHIMQISGRGTISCSTMTSNLHEQSIEWENIYKTWINGFFSGVNASLKGKADFAENVDEIAKLKFVARYCEENPTDSVFVGTLKLFEKLNGTELNKLTR